MRLEWRLGRGEGSAAQICRGSVFQAEKRGKQRAHLMGLRMARDGQSHGMGGVRVRENVK